MKRILIAIAAFVATSVNVLAQPQFSLAWSEYPSWSTFGVAAEKGFINGAAGKLGSVETKYGVDIVLKQAEYDPCLMMYAAKQTDLVCITNMDVLNPSLSVPSVAIMVTSTSNGADGLIVSKTITSLDDLKGRKVYGLDKTVSAYFFYRLIENTSSRHGDFLFSNMDPGAAAQAMQQKQPGFDAIVVWNPYLNQTLNSRSDVRVLADSSSIPGEILDMVVMSREAYNREGGRTAALAVADAFYQVCGLMASPSTRDETLIALGEKFSNLDLQGMRRCVQQTQFYSTPASGLAIFTGKTLPDVMDKVTTFCVKTDIVSAKPAITFGSSNYSAGSEKVNLRFEPSIMQALADSSASNTAGDAPRK